MHEAFPQGIVVPGDQERYVRGLMNGYSRAQEVDAAQQTVRELQAKLAASEAEAKVYREQSGDVYPQDFAAKYEELKATWGPEEADRYKRGVEAEMHSRVDEQREVALREHQQEQGHQAAEQTWRQSLRLAEEHFPDFDDNDLRRVWRLYTSELDDRYAQTGQANWSWDEWRAVANTVQLRRPGFMEKRAADAAERLKAEVDRRATLKAEELKRSDAERHAAAVVANPVTAHPHVETGHATHAPGATGEQPISVTDKMKGLRRQMRNTKPY